MNERAPKSKEAEEVPPGVIVGDYHGGESLEPLEQFYLNLAHSYNRVGRDENKELDPSSVLRSLAEILLHKIDVDEDALGNKENLIMVAKLRIFLSDKDGHYIQEYVSETEDSNNFEKENNGRFEDLLVMAAQLTYNEMKPNLSLYELSRLEENVEQPLRVRDIAQRKQREAVPLAA